VVADMESVVRTHPGGVLYVNASASPSGANGTSEHPFTTIQAALNSLQKYLKTNTDIRIAPGTYAPFSVTGFLGNHLTIQSLSASVDDVKIYAPTGATAITVNNCGNAVVLSNMAVGSDPETAAAQSARNGIAVSNCKNVHCSGLKITNLRENTNVPLNVGIGCALSNLYAFNCTADNVGAMFHPRNGGIIIAVNCTSTNTSYGVFSYRSVVFLAGTKPTGTVTNETLSGGLIIS
jgi:hypothetical protein